MCGNIDATAHSDRRDLRFNVRVARSSRTLFVSVHVLLLGAIKLAKNPWRNET